MSEHLAKRVLITGSRDWDDYQLLAFVLGATYTELGPYVLVHGDARGADRMAARIVTDHGLTTEPHPADWDRLGKRAGFVRNAEMVDLGADLCLAFWDGVSKGTKSTIDLARRAGIPVRVYTPGGGLAHTDDSSL